MKPLRWFVVTCLLAGLALYLFSFSAKLQRDIDHHNVMHCYNNGYPAQVVKEQISCEQ